MNPSPLGLPRLMLVTQRALMNPFAQVLGAALQDGARLIQLREKGLESRQLHSIVTLALDLCAGRGATLVVNGSADVARAAGAQGVHLPLSAFKSECDLLVGASVHSLEEARRARELGADYVVLGSIFPTASHPGGEVLGLQVLEEIAREVSVPIFAIGGITAENARACLDAGAYGVAAIRAAWEGEERRKLLRAVGDV